MSMTLSFTLKIKFVAEIIRKSCVGNLLRELLIIKNKEDLTVFHSVACEQALPQHSGSVVKRKESWQSRLRSLNSAGLSVLANQCGAEMSIKCTWSTWKINFAWVNKALKLWLQQEDETPESCWVLVFVGRSLRGPDQKTNIQKVANHH